MIIKDITDWLPSNKNAILDILKMADTDLAYFDYNDFLSMSVTNLI